MRREKKKNLLRKSVLVITAAIVTEKNKVQMK